MRSEPYARGRCHRANYWELTQILVSDVDAANSIAVVCPATLGTPKHTPLDLAPHMPTAGTGPAGIVLVLQSYSHAQPLSFVGEFKADRAMRPLMNFLVVGVSNIVVLPDISDIANDHRLHALLMQRGDKPRGLLMFDILDLML